MGFKRLFLSLTLLVPIASASDNARAPGARVAVRSSSVAIADFDGDSQPDAGVFNGLAGVTVQGIGKVDFRFSNRPQSTIHFESDRSSKWLAALDIDHDQDLDVILERPVTQEAVQIWLNDGDGDFVRARLVDFPDATRPVRSGIQAPRDPVAAIYVVAFPSRRAVHDAPHCERRPAIVPVLATRLSPELLAPSPVELLSLPCVPRAPPAL